MHFHIEYWYRVINTWICSWFWYAVLSLLSSHSLEFDLIWFMRGLRVSLLELKQTPHLFPVAWGSRPWNWLCKFRDGTYEREGRPLSPATCIFICQSICEIVLCEPPLYFSLGKVPRKNRSNSSVRSLSRK